MKKKTLLRRPGHFSRHDNHTLWQSCFRFRWERVWDIIGVRKIPCASPPASAVRFCTWAICVCHRQTPRWENSRTAIMQTAKNAFLLSALRMFPAPFPFQDSFLTIAKHLRLVNRCGYIFHKPAQCLFRRRNRFLRNTFGQPAEKRSFFLRHLLCERTALLREI